MLKIPIPTSRLYTSDNIENMFSVKSIAISKTVDFSSTNCAMGCIIVLSAVLVVHVFLAAAMLGLTKSNSSPALSTATFLMQTAHNVAGTLIE